MRDDEWCSQLGVQMSTSREVTFVDGQLVWVINAPGALWARVIGIRGEALRLETPEGELLGWYDVSDVLTENEVAEVLNKDNLQPPQP